MGGQRFTPGGETVLTAQGTGWTIRTGAENLAPRPTGIRSPDRPARSQSLYGPPYRRAECRSGVKFISIAGLDTAMPFAT